MIIQFYSGKWLVIDVTPFNRIVMTLSFWMFENCNATRLIWLTRSITKSIWVFDVWFCCAAATGTGYSRSILEVHGVNITRLSFLLAPHHESTNHRGNGPKLSIRSARIPAFARQGPRQILYAAYEDANVHSIYRGALLCVRYGLEFGIFRRVLR